MAPKLTATGIAQLRPHAKRREVRDGTSGLILLVQPSGAKSWALRYRRPRPDGRMAKLTLGPLLDERAADAATRRAQGEPELGQSLSLAAARLLAARVKQQRATGRDPGDDYQKQKAKHLSEAAARATSTFGSAVRAYVEDHVQPNLRRWRETAGTLGLRPGESGLEEIKGGLAERWRDKPLAEIAAPDVRALLTETRRAVPGRKARAGRGAASRRRALHAALRKFFNWAITDYDITGNPCENLGCKAPKARDRKLSDDEVRLFWKACDQIGEPFGPLFQLLLLVGQRRDEIARMARNELSADVATLVLPASRTKNKREHTVPLAPAAREIIRGVHRIAGCRFVFSTNGRTPVSGFSKSKRQLDAVMLKLSDGVAIPAWTLHDLRRTCATGLARLGVPLEVTEKILNHVSGSFGGIVSVYQQHDYLEERRDALKRWAARIQKIATGA